MKRVPGVLSLSPDQYRRWWTTSPAGIILPVLSYSALTWFIMYVYYWSQNVDI